MVAEISLLFAAMTLGVIMLGKIEYARFKEKQEERELKKAKQALYKQYLLSRIAKSA